MIDKNFCTETKIVGVTKLNDHNIPIQSLLPSLKEGDRIILVRDYGNEYDENAIKIYNRDGNHIGYLSASLAENISPFLEENPKYDIEGIVKCLTGGTDGKSYGCNITIWMQDPDEPSYEELHAFARNFCGTDSQESKNTKNANEAQFRKNQAIIDQEVKTTNSNWTVFLITVIISFLVFIGGILLIMCILGYGFSADVSDSEKGSQHSSQERGIDEHLITLNEYNQLRSGMSRLEVYDIVGSFGTKTSETGNSADDYHIVMYLYDGYGDTGANAQLMFINGELDTMAQYGLESYYGKEYGGESSSDDLSSSIFSASENEVLVKVTDIDLKTKILPPDSIGTVWMEAIYTNNSKYTISSVSYKYLCKDTNETHYLSTYDTVLPGETSPKFDTFGPESGKESDIEFLTCRIVVLGENNEKVFIDYDYKLGTYEMV